MSEIKRLETERLILRSIRAEDSEDIFSMRNNTKMHLFTDTVPDKTIDDTNQYINKMIKGVSESKWYIWAIEDKQSSKVIGTISIWNFDESRQIAELGYGIVPDYQRKGLMLEALSVIIDYGFNDLSLKAIDAYTERGNIPSVKLLEKSGFDLIDHVEDLGTNNQRTYYMNVYRKNNNK